MRDIEEKQAAKLASEQNGGDEAKIKRKSSLTAVDQHCLWYPTVRRAILCLSKLYKCLDVSALLRISANHDFSLILAVCIFERLARYLGCVLPVARVRSLSYTRNPD